MTRDRTRTFDVIVGLVAGSIVGAIVAVNFIITVGIGYDVSIPDIFRESVLAGIVTIGILVAGPIVGVILMRRRRRKRASVDEQRVRNDP
ncbi:MAG: hypothetical protein R2823_08095 [Acidimicrobiia bacterium]